MFKALDFKDFEASKKEGQAPLRYQKKWTIRLHSTLWNLPGVWQPNKHFPYAPVSCKLQSLDKYGSNIIAFAN